MKMKKNLEPPPRLKLAFNLLGQDYSQQEIADEMKVGLATVQQYLQRLKPYFEDEPEMQPQWLENKGSLQEALRRIYRRRKESEQIVERSREFFLPHSTKSLLRGDHSDALGMLEYAEEELKTTIEGSGNPYNDLFELLATILTYKVLIYHETLSPAEQYHKVNEIIRELKKLSVQADSSEIKCLEALCKASSKYVQGRFLTSSGNKALAARLFADSISSFKFAHDLKNPRFQLMAENMLLYNYAFLEERSQFNLLAQRIERDIEQGKYSPEKIWYIHEGIGRGRGIFKEDKGIYLLEDTCKQIELEAPGLGCTIYTCQLNRSLLEAIIQIAPNDPFVIEQKKKQAQEYANWARKKGLIYRAQELEKSLGILA